MKVIYDQRFTEVYCHDPAATAGRMEAVHKELAGRFEFIQPAIARVEDLKLVHAESHITEIQKSRSIYNIALLAAGAAIKAAELAINGEPAFALIRPPGHHASRDHCWGFCFFNNIAISVAKLRIEKKVKTALILDVDLHFGDGTANIFNNTPEVTYFHPEASNRNEFIHCISEFLTQQQTDVIAVSAGFDRHEADWGGMLKTEDYHTIGRLTKEFAERVCKGRRYGVLEGGYNHQVLGSNVKSFLDAMS